MSTHDGDGEIRRAFLRSVALLLVLTIGVVVIYYVATHHRKGRASPRERIEFRRAVDGGLVP
jgi:hypothetical protein